MTLIEGWYTPQEASTELAISSTAIRQAISRGTLQAKALHSNAWLISAEELERYKAEHLRKHPGRPRKKKAQEE